MMTKKMKDDGGEKDGDGDDDKEGDGDDDKEGDGDHDKDGVDDKNYDDNGRFGHQGRAQRQGCQPGKVPPGERRA